MADHGYIKKVDGKPVAVMVRRGSDMVFTKQSLQARIETLDKQNIDTSTERKTLKLLEEEEAK